MFKRLTRSAVQALAKKGCAAKPIAGSAMAAEIQWNMSRVASEAPDQTDTDNSITFMDAKPATASRISRSRPALSFWVALSAVASSSCASYPFAASSGIRSSARRSGSASIMARLRVRLTRAECTCG